MEALTDSAAQRAAQLSIEVADTTLAYRTVPIADATPSGAQLAEAAGFRSVQNVIVMHLLPTGDLEDIRPTETVELAGSTRRFVIVESDRTFLLSINGQRFDWPSGVISGGVIRKLGGVAAGEDVFLDRAEVADQRIRDLDLARLDGAGVESFVSRKKTWQLNVQGVLLTLDQASIKVRDAMSKAGFDVNQAWLIFLKVEGQPKQAVDMNHVIDLTTPGIEKLRLTPKDVNNGEAPVAPRRDFALLDADDAYLDSLGLRWETVIDSNRRWLLLHNYPVPFGYVQRRTTLALEIPLLYPSAQIDMFYAYPALALTSGREIPSTQVRASIFGDVYHGWSRHRAGASQWNPASDNVASQMALVEAAIAKELGQ
jgi:hypothetical protein